jgi:hypothetical protein
MPAEPIKNLLPRLRNRREYFDYLDRWAVGTVDELQAQRTTRALVKGYLLETSRTNGARDAVQALSESGQLVEEVDQGFFRLRSKGEDGHWAIAQVDDARYPVIYSALESELANRRVDQLVSRTPLLDKAWFAAPLFQRLWRLVVSAYPHHRFSRIVFEHESLYEAISDEPVGSDTSDKPSEDLDLSDESIEEWQDEPPYDVERRRARMQITERVGRLATALDGMREYYDPLESIVTLRIPAPRRGGHDVYYDGRFTNRSESIVAFQQTIEAVKTIYASATNRAEELAWADPVAPNRPMSLGVPLLITFNERLATETFDRWVSSLRRKNNRFRLWANPLALGTGKVHLYAVDNHLWQPIDIEITLDHAFAYLPQGTCGNTIHRLVTNIQRFVDPKPAVHLGNQAYEDLIAQAPALPVDGGTTGG